MLDKVLVTGSRGMLGRNICDHLSSMSFNLLTPDHATLDLLDFSQTSNFLHTHKPDIIIHCAGVVGGIQANMAQPALFLADNMRIGMNIIYSAYREGVKFFLNMGSSCMYPANSPHALTEDMILSEPLEPTNEGYAIAKCAATRLCQYITNQDSEFHYKTIVPCNLYGKYDKFDPVSSHMIPAIIQKIDYAINHDLTDVEIWGDGTARREFMYAGDLAMLVGRALLQFAELPDVMNAGIGRDYTVNEYYTTIGNILGYKGQFYHNTAKPAGMRRKLVDIARQQAFGFTPAHTLEEGIRQTYEWYKTIQACKSHME